jgi:hypothetical protein
MCQHDSAPVEQIEDGDAVSRLIEKPSMVNDSTWHWQAIFPFPSKDGRIESVVWRRKKVHDQEVHELGVARQTAKRARGKQSDYLGFITAVAGQVRAARTTRGLSFLIKHAPGEGDWRAHMQLVEPVGIVANSNDLWDARGELEKIFSDLVPVA